MKLLNAKFLILTVFMSVISTDVMAYDLTVNGMYFNFWNGEELEVTFGNNYGTAYYSGNIEIPKTVEHNGATFSVTKIETWLLATVVV